MSKYTHHRVMHAHSRNTSPAVPPLVMLTEYIQPALAQIGLLDPNTEKLLMGTAAIESRFTYLTQIPTGPARGYWQMERETHTDLWDSFLSQKKNAVLVEKLKLILNG